MAALHHYWDEARTSSMQNAAQALQPEVRGLNGVVLRLYAVFFHMVARFLLSLSARRNI